MKQVRNFALAPFLVILLGLSSCNDDGAKANASLPKLKTVMAVDLARYSGKWYEIARYPNRFERNCEFVTAQYTPRADGRIDVLNTCNANMTDNNRRSAKGIASVIAGSNNARLAVNFAPFPLPAGQGNYQILYLDSEYQTAVVGSPGRNYLWFLSRTPQIDDQTKNKLLDAARANLFDVSKLENVRQN